MKIRIKALTVILLAAILPFLLISVSTYITTKRIITNEEIDHLESVAQIQESRIVSMIYTNLERLKLVASRTQLRLSLNEYIHNPDSQYQEKMNKILSDALSSIIDFREISVLTLDGKIAASTNPDNIGTIFSDTELFMRAQKENIVDSYFVTEDYNLEAQLCGPLILNKELIGVVVVESRADMLLSLVRNYSGLGDTGEVVVARRNEAGDAQFITPLRFDQDAALRRTIPKDDVQNPVTKALEMEERVFTDTVDYRGKPVLAATRYIENVDWGLVVKIDKSEVFAPVSRMLLMIVINIIFFITLLTVFALTMSKSITKPIINLTRTAKKISDGDISTRVQVTSNDEIGDLSYTFNQMTEKLIQSIKASREAEQAARKLQERLQLQIDRMPLGLITWDTDFKVQAWNPAAEEMFGFTQEEALGRYSYGLIVENSSKSQVEAVWQRLLDGDMTAHSTNENTTKDGRTILCEWINIPLKEDNGKVVGVLSMVRDITEKVQLEKRFQQAQKLEAVGRLVGGVAHDFNNALTGIIGFADYLLMSTKEDDPNRQYIEEMKKAGQRAAALTHQLLAFSRKQVLKPEVISLNELIQALEKMIRRLIGEDILFVTKLQPELGQIKADPAQVEQIIMNLVVNARDAMKTGGKLTIETQNVHLDKNYAKTHIAVEPGRYIMLAISDNGIGMDKETQEHIFEPFFTTKEEKGTGLGLSTVYGIVKQSGGNIWVYSEPEKGTTFKVYLPGVEEAFVIKKKAEKAVEALKGTETVLVVEDELVVREMIVLVLKDNGYTVLEASNGPEALAIFEQYKDQVNLLLTDAIMPGMNGKELTDRITAMNPNIKVLYTSGYTDDVIVHHGILEEGINFIQKPFVPSLLLQMVREVFEKE
jgi:PAS domain S-box-containing protein